MRAARAEFGHKGVIVTIKGGVIPTRCPTGRVGIASQQHVARGVHRNAGAQIAAAFAQVGAPVEVGIDNQLDSWIIRAAGAECVAVVVEQNKAAGDFYLFTVDDLVDIKILINYITQFGGDAQAAVFADRQACDAVVA